MGRNLVSETRNPVRPMEGTRPLEPRVPSPRPRRRRLPPGALRDMFASMFLAVGLAAGCHTFVAEARFIPSPSMVPTLAVGDRLVIEKVAYRFAEPRRYDVVVFKPPQSVAALVDFDPSVPWIKRVMALPGESVAVMGGHVIVNGKRIDDPFPTEAADYDMPTREVPQGQLFVLGDNRNHSIDSHVWGTVGEDRVIGRACFRFWPPNRFGGVGGIG